MAAFVGGAVAAYALTKRYGEPNMQFQVGGKKKSPEEILEEKGYWPGEWACADCGYIYDNVYQRVAFEELRPRWKCPQCAGPRRRFVKKAGGITAVVDDSPLLIGTAVAALLIIVLVYLGLTL
jgi:rubredoxin